MAYRWGARRPRQQEAKVVAVATDKVPQEVGYPAEMNWTPPLVQGYIQDTFAVRVSERGRRHLLYRLGFSCTRSTYTLAKTDPCRQAEFQVGLDAHDQYSRIIPATVANRMRL